MTTVELTQHIEYVFALSYQKCGNISQAEDLAQEALLAAIAALNKNNEVVCPKAWLKTIVNRTWIHQLCYKYKQPMTIYDMPDIPNDAFHIDAELIRDEEYRLIRRELAHLAKTYRDVIVLYYVKGKSTADIAKELNIPKGTVLSRLDKGRKLIRNGVEDMSGYGERSYRPDEMSFGITGRVGNNDEPFNVMGNLLAKNIAMCAYEKPLSEKEIADEIGVALPYVEETVDRLVKAELMKRESGKVQTNFIITTQEDNYKALKVIEGAICGFEPLYYQAQEHLHEIAPLNRAELDDEYLKCFLIISSLNNANKKARRRLVETIEFADFPDRPNNGKWFAAGMCKKSDYPADKMDEILANTTSGLLSSDLIDDKIIRIEDMDTRLGPTHWVYQFESEVTVSQRELAKLLYRIYTKSDLHGYESIKIIPTLVRLNIVRRDGEDIEVNVPIFSPEGADRLNQVCSGIADIILPQYTIIMEKLVAFLKSSYSRWYDKMPDIIVGFFCSLIDVPIVRWLINRRLLKLDLSKANPFMYMVINP